MKRSWDLPSAGSMTRSVEAEVGDLLVQLLSSAREHFMRGLAEVGLTQPQGFALHQLDEPLPMRQLAHELGYDASHITGIVDRLEERGLVERRPDERDRRIKLLVITDEGREVRRRIQDRIFDSERFLEGLDDDERRALRDLLRRAVAPAPPVERPDGHDGA